MLPEQHRLRRNARIREVRRSGRQWRHPLLLLFTLANQQDASRFAISVSRRVGNAVVRNRCKRRVREAIRLQLPDMEGGCDGLFVVRPDLVAAPYADVEAAVRDLLGRAGLLQHLPGT